MTRSTTALVRRLESERTNPVPRRPPVARAGMAPVTPEQAAENRRVLLAALAAGPDLSIDPIRI